MIVINPIEMIEKRIKENKFIVFDLDGTLFDEKIWLHACYGKIAQVAFPDDENKKKIAFDFLCKIFEEEGRKDLFGKMKDKFPKSRGNVDLWLTVMRQTVVEGGLPIFDWAIKIISKYPSNCIAILTNGNPCQQRKKFEQLNPAAVTKNLMLVCANEIEAKPSPKGLFMIGDILGLKLSDLVMVGDSENDLECSKRAGVDFIQVVNR